MRSTDYVGRWGGEEFLIVCPNITLSETEQVAKKLLGKISEYNFAHGEHVTASIGISCFKEDLNINSIIEKTDNALYRSKQQGRNQITISN